MKKTKKIFNNKRGKFLCLHAMIFLGIGYSYVVPGVSLASRNRAFSWLPDHYFTLDSLGWIWIISAIIGLASGIAYNPPRSDKVGFAAITAAPLAWSIINTISWIFGYSDTAWISSILFGGYACIIMLVSSWPNPTEASLVPIPLPDDVLDDDVQGE